MGKRGPGSPLIYMSTITNLDSMSVLSRIQKFLYSHRERGHQTRRLSSVFYCIRNNNYYRNLVDVWLEKHIFTSKNRKTHYFLVLIFLTLAQINFETLEAHRIIFYLRQMDQKSKKVQKYQNNVDLKQPGHGSWRSRTTFEIHVHDHQP